MDKSQDQELEMSGDMGADMRDLHTRVTRLESAFETVKMMLEGVDKKLDGISSLANRIVGLEERHIASSTAMERQFDAISKMEQRTATTQHECQETASDLKSRVAWVRGVIFAAGGFFMLIQALVGGYAIMVENRLSRVEHHLESPHSTPQK